MKEATGLDVDGGTAPPPCRQAAPSAALHSGRLLGLTGRTVSLSYGHTASPPSLHPDTLRGEVPVAPPPALRAVSLPRDLPPDSLHHTFHRSPSTPVRSHSPCAPGNNASGRGPLPRCSQGSSGLGMGSLGQPGGLSGRRGWEGGCRLAPAVWGPERALYPPTPTPSSASGHRVFDYGGELGCRGLSSRTVHSARRTRECPL